MAALTIRNIDDSIKVSLRVRAAQHGHSMEEEARRILAQALRDTDTASGERLLGSRLHQHFAGLGDVPATTRRVARAAPDFVVHNSKRK